MVGLEPNDIIIIRWVWIALNIILILYAIGLFIYARYFRKNEILVYVNI